MTMSSPRILSEDEYADAVAAAETAYRCSPSEIAAVVLAAVGTLPPPPEPETTDGSVPRCAALFLTAEGMWTQCTKPPHEGAHMNEEDEWVWPDGVPGALPARTETGA